MTPTRALIEAAEAMRNEITGILGYCEGEMRLVMGNTNIAVLKNRLELLTSAISSAKAAEEGVETMYRVDVMDRIGWVMTTYDRFHETEEAASKRTDLAFKSAEPIVSARIVRVETRETVIEVKEKEGL